MEELITFCGQLAGLVVVVVMFIRHLERKDSAAEKLNERTCDTIDRNTEAFGRIEAVVQRCHKAQED